MFSLSEQDWLYSAELLFTSKLVCLEGIYTYPLLPLCTSVTFLCVFASHCVRCIFCLVIDVRKARVAHLPASVTHRGTLGLRPDRLANCIWQMPLGRKESQVMSPRASCKSATVFIKMNQRGTLFMIVTWRLSLDHCPSFFTRMEVGLHNIRKTTHLITRLNIATTCLAISQWLFWDHKRLFMFCHTPLWGWGAEACLSILWTWSSVHLDQSFAGLILGVIHLLTTFNLFPIGNLDSHIHLPHLLFGQ